MNVMAEIRQQLLSGKQPVELVKDGYAKSTVYYVAKSVRLSQSAVPELSDGDELTELRRRKEIIKLQKEIAELEASKEKLPERVAWLEGQVEFLNELVRSVGDTLCYFVFLVSKSTDEAGAKKEADDWVKKMIEPLVKSRLGI